MKPSSSFPMRCLRPRLDSPRPRRTHIEDAETKAGQDPVKIAACAATPAAKEAIDASLALGASGRESHLPFS